MLTDFEGAIRRSEVGFHIWTSKEVCQSFSHPLLLVKWISQILSIVVNSQFKWRFVGVSNGKAAINGVVLVLQFHQYQVVGRKLPTASDEHPKIYRMKLWATNEVRAKSKYFLRKLKKVKKSNG
ncbi:unnamed protein product [Prunus brigantina]